MWRTLDEQLDWFELREGEYEPLDQDEQGRLRSRVFPGLWLAVTPLLAGDLALVLAELQQGIDADEHTTFVQRRIVGSELRAGSRPGETADGEVSREGMLESWSHHGPGLAGCEALLGVVTLECSG